MHVKIYVCIELHRSSEMGGSTCDIGLLLLNSHTFLNCNCNRLHRFTGSFLVILF